jgi:hypothetical protein
MFKKVRKLFKFNSACNEIGRSYEEGYKSKCQQNYTESHCMILIRGEKNYCPFHPDIPECADFLHNATNKDQREVLKDPSCAQSLVSCPNEINAERYCLNTNDPAFCKTIGDICDEDGFVKPEYPYCTTN